MIEIKITGETKDDLFKGVCELFYAFATSNRTQMSDQLVALDDKQAAEADVPVKVESVLSEITAEDIKPISEMPKEKPVKAKTAKPVITMPELQALAISKTKEHGREPLKAVLEELGAAKVTAILPEQFEAAKALLEAING